MNKIEVLKKRSAIENEIRKLLFEHDFVEVRTPSASKYADIAPVEQFCTRFPNKNENLYLRIAPTEYLKKLIYIGMEAIFEFSTNFRNDEIDSTHLPEFVSLEIMKKNATVYDMMDLAEVIIKEIIRLYNQDGKLMAISNLQWKRIILEDYLWEQYRFESYNDLKKINSLCTQIFGKDILFVNSKTEALEKLIAAISIKFDAPVFIGGFPWDLGGPAKPTDDSYRYKERFELYYKGYEIANMSSTLTEYNTVLKWYTATMESKQRICRDSFEMDVSLMKAFENGMPESAVVGIGIERLICLVLSLDEISQSVSFTYE